MKDHFLVLPVLSGVWLEMWRWARVFVAGVVASVGVLSGIFLYRRLRPTPEPQEEEEETPGRRLVAKIKSSLQCPQIFTRLMSEADRSQEPFFPDSTKLILCGFRRVEEDAEDVVLEWNLLRPEEPPVPRLVVKIPNADGSLCHCSTCGNFIYFNLAKRNDGIVRLIIDLRSGRHFVEKFLDYADIAGRIKLHLMVDPSTDILLTARENQVKICKYNRTAFDSSLRLITAITTVTVPGLEEDDFRWIQSVPYTNGRCIIRVAELEVFILLDTNTGFAERMDASQVPEQLMTFLMLFRNPYRRAFHGSLLQGPRQVFEIEKGSDETEWELYETRLEPPSLQLLSLQLLLRSRPDLLTLEEAQLHRLGLSPPQARFIVGRGRRTQDAGRRSRTQKSKFADAKINL